MSMTRGKTKDLEANRQEGGSEAVDNKSELTSKQSSFQSALKKLAYFDRSTVNILRDGGQGKLDRQRKLLGTKLDECLDLIQDIQGIFIDLDEQEEAIDSWTNKAKESLEPYESSIENLDSKLSECEEQIRENQRMEQLEREAIMKARLRREEEEAEVARQIRQEKFALELEKKKLDLSETKHVQTKLPDLQISKFQGTHLDWVRFWSLFQTQIDKAPINDEAKFSYLKEFVIPKVRSTIEKLPVDSGGYERAKTILQQRYGDPAEVVNAHIQQIFALPTIHGTSRPKIHEFYDQLLCHVQALDTLGKLGNVAGNVRMTLDKLEGIRSDITRMDPEWKNWGFQELLEALRGWIDRNPLQIGERDSRTQPRDFRREKTFSTRDQTKPRSCIYCDKTDHKASDCESVKTVEERRKILSNKRLCFNCTGEKHRASDCRSKTNCQVCHKRHHTSICDNKQKEPGMTAAANNNTVIHPVVVIKVEGVKCRALLDTGSSSNYMSSTLLDLIKKNPVRQEHKSIETLLGTSAQNINVYEVEISDVAEKFSIKSEVNGVARKVLLNLPNPKYQEVIQANAHLKGVRMEDNDSKEILPVHVILGASSYSVIKTSTPTRVGKAGEPIAEKTSLGWVIMSPGREGTHSALMYTRSSHDEYMQLCSLDVLGVEDRPEGDQQSVYEEFKEQLVQREDGRYETSLPWKATHPALPTNETVAKARFNSLMRRLEKQPELLQAYHTIIQDQLREGIVEVAPEKPQGPEHYIPHKPVVRENAQSTKVRIVYDASAKADSESPSLNECLDIGPPLQRKILDILLRVRFKPVFLAGDMKQAFLQVAIRETERDVLRFFWVEDLESKKPVIYRVTRALFGLGPSPFLLGGTLEQHLEKFATQYPDQVREIREGMYVDDINLGGNNVDEIRDLKQTAVSIFEEGGFELHKWHSNEVQLDGEAKNDNESTFAKDTLGTKAFESKLLGVGWDKQSDTLSVTFPESEPTPTKRVVLRTLAKIYDPMGIASPLLLTGKLIFRDICERKIPWDSELPDDLKKRWEKWLKTLPSEIVIPRCIPQRKEEITSIELHGFSDASVSGCCATVYAVVKQGEEVTQGLLVAKSRLAKRDLTIPRLELVGCHMTSNLLENTAKALAQYPVTAIYAWTDSTVCLHWLQEGVKYKQFVSNRVKKINEKQYTWRYVPTGENPADIGSRGGSNLQENEKWMRGPTWLSTPEWWPTMIVTKASEDSDSEKQLLKEIMQVSVEREADTIDALLKRKSWWTTVRVLARIKRFINNSKNSQRVKGPLTTSEIQEQINFMVKRAQRDVEETSQFKNDSERLNLVKNEEGIYECRGRIQGVYPCYLPFRHLTSEKLVENAHLQTLHGGVSLTMSKVRDSYWIPKLRSITKRVLKKCSGCKRFHATAEPTPPQGNLPRERSEGNIPFDVVGVDFAGPITVKTGNKAKSKAYIILYTCSLTRGLHLELLPNMTCEEFLSSFKRFIAARGRPSKIISDNGSTFIAASKWIKKVRKSEKVQEYLAQQGIIWQFNLSRASWWGGMFERMVSIVKGAMYKVVGAAKLSFKELQEVILDIQIVLNNRPLTYCEDDVEMPVLTPNMLIFGKANYLPDEEPSDIQDRDLRKRAKYLRKCKDALWKRWESEYVRALRERHNAMHSGKQAQLEKGDVVMIKGEEKNRALWKIGIVTELIPGRDNIVRAVRLRAGKSFMERPIQFLYPLELHCSRSKEMQNQKLNAEAQEFRPKRKAAIDAAANVQGTFDYEEENDF